MAAYLIGQITVKNPTLWKAYTEGVAESIKGFDCELVFRGKKYKDLADENRHKTSVVLKFKDENELDAWFNSSKYQSLIENRDKAADIMITTYSEV